MAKDIPMGHTYRGAVPFILSDFLRVAILVAVPSITLFAVRGG